jgi:hypothetical protein
MHHAMAATCRRPPTVLPYAIQCVNVTQQMDRLARHEHDGIVSHAWRCSCSQRLPVVI